MPSSWRVCLPVSAGGRRPRLSGGGRTLPHAPSPHGPPGTVAAAAAGTASLSAAAAPRSYKRFIKVSVFYFRFLDPEGWSQNATLVVLLVVAGISSLKIPKAFLICSAAQRNFAYIFVLIFPTDLPSQIFKLIFN